MFLQVSNIPIVIKRMRNWMFWRHHSHWCMDKLVKIMHGTYYIILIIIIFSRSAAHRGLLVHKVSWSHTTTSHIRWDSSGRVMSSPQRPLPDNTQQTNIPAPGAIRTHDLSRRAAVVLRLWPRCHWDRQIISILHLSLNLILLQQ
jgi:hypothetical protein